MPNWKALPIGTAVRKLVQQREQQLSPRTCTSWKSTAKQLELVIGKKPLNTISNSDLEHYQAERIAKGIRPSSVNTELSVARVALKRAGRWHKLAERFHPARVEAITPGQAITPEQQAHLLQVARSKRRWHEVADAIAIALTTGMRSGEIRLLQWKDVDLTSRTLTIRRSKTPAGWRAIPLNNAAWEVLAARLRSAVKRGAAEQEHYVFPGRKKTAVRIPRGNFFTAFAAIRKAAGLPTFRFHDMRHTAITTMCEGGVPDWIIRSQVGHVDQRVLALYSHVRMSAMQQAADALQPRPPGQDAKGKRKQPRKVRS